MADNIKHQTNAGNPQDAEPGKGAAGNQWAVQTAQNVNVNDPEERIPSGADVEQNKEQLEEYAQQEEGTLPTHHGFVVDEAGKIDNYPIEPPMEVEE